MNRKLKKMIKEIGDSLLLFINCEDATPHCLLNGNRGADTILGNGGDELSVIITLHCSKRDT